MEKRGEKVRKTDIMFTSFQYFRHFCNLWWAKSILGKKKCYPAPSSDFWAGFEVFLKNKVKLLGERSGIIRPFPGCCPS